MEMQFQADLFVQWLTETSFIISLNETSCDKYVTVSATCFPVHKLL